MYPHRADTYLGTLSTFSKVPYFCPRPPVVANDNDDTDDNGAAVRQRLEKPQPRPGVFPGPVAHTVELFVTRDLPRAGRTRGNMEHAAMTTTVATAGAWSEAGGICISPPTNQDMDNDAAARFSPSIHPSIHRFPGAPLSVIAHLDRNLGSRSRRCGTVTARDQQSPSAMRTTRPLRAGHGSGGLVPRLVAVIVFLPSSPVTPCRWSTQGPICVGIVYTTLVGWQSPTKMPRGNTIKNKTAQRTDTKANVGFSRPLVDLNGTHAAVVPDTLGDLLFD
ncbi:hypothetical protein LZ30DRAFT_689420 [Colletotrichum cereale]|nr:hypothetical protein LZ30DRAFT_689420 [Colletotrichum cereale]